MQTTKTLNRLPFEELEPHRFEDLVRQLAYYFKAWQRLEGTGRSGADEGFDIRGIEDKVVTEEEKQESNEEASPVLVEQRTWLIQCKREKRIGPADIKRYIDEITAQDKIYGVIFVGACDFSKKTRDAFYNKIREKGYLEGYLWGKSELEDMLFQPKNDHLLFAYFGISLQIKQRSMKTFLNSKLTTKRKLVKIFGDIKNPRRHRVLLRDVNDQAYPYKDEVKDFKNNPPWALRNFVEYYHDGIVILSKEFFAYSNNETEEWDFYEKEFSRAINGQDPWEEDSSRQERHNSLIHDYWFYRMPEDNRAWLRMYAFLPFERIVAIDEIGDEHTNEYGQECPHLYVTYHLQNGFHDGRVKYLIESGGRQGHRYRPQKDMRIKYFPESLPEISKEEKDKKFKDTGGSSKK